MSHAHHAVVAKRVDSEGVTVRAGYVEVEVPADPDQDDCLAAAVDEYISDRPGEQKN